MLVSFSGSTASRNSIGRSGFPGHSALQMHRSLVQNLFPVPQSIPKQGIVPLIHRKSQLPDLSFTLRQLELCFTALR